MNKKGMPANKMTGFRMTGGVEISFDDAKRFPEANYWRSGALWADNQMTDMFPDDIRRYERILEKFWTDDNTWMSICLRAEHMLDLCKALVNKEK